MTKRPNIADFHKLPLDDAIVLASKRRFPCTLLAEVRGLDVQFVGRRARGLGIMFSSGGTVGFREMEKWRAEIDAWRAQNTAHMQEETAKRILRKHYSPVYCAAVSGGRVDRFYVGTRLVSRATMFELARQYDPDTMITIEATPNVKDAA